MFVVLLKLLFFGRVGGISIYCLFGGLLSILVVGDVGVAYLICAMSRVAVKVSLIGRSLYERKSG